MTADECYERAQEIFNASMRHSECSKRRTKYRKAEIDKLDGHERYLVKTYLDNICAKRKLRTFTRG